MRVLIVPSWYPTKYNELNGSFFKEQAEAIAKNSCDVAVLAINTVGIKDLIRKFNKLDLFKITDKQIQGVHTFSINIFGFGLTKTKLFYLIYCLILKSLYNKLKLKFGVPDIVHAHSYKYAGYGCLKIFESLPIVVTEHSSSILLNELKNYDIPKLVYTVNNASRFIAVSNYLKDKIIEITKHKFNILVIPNIVSNIFKYEPYTYQNTIFVFCSVSNLIPNKKVDLLIKSFYKCFSNNKNVYLKIAGDGIETPKLLKMINDFGLSDRIILLGQIDRNSVLKLYKTSNVFVMLSQSETFGVVYAESLMCGLPTIGTHNGGADDILDCYGGYLCEVDNIDDISNKMIDVYNNYKTIDRERIYLEAVSRFSEDKVAKRIIDVYKEVIQ